MSFSTGWGTGISGGARVGHGETTKIVDLPGDRRTSRHDARGSRKADLGRNFLEEQNSFESYKKEQF